MIALRDQQIYTDGLVSLLHKFSSFELLEIAGLGKIWGHPFISGEEGIEKLYDRITSDKGINMDYLLLTRNLIMRDYCKSFFDKNKVWPSVTSGGERIHRALSVAIERNVWLSDPILLEYGGEPDLIFGSHLVPLKQIDFHVRTNVIPLLKDRYLAVSRSDAVRYYIGNEKIRWNTKKVLLRFLDLLCSLLNYMLATVEAFSLSIVRKEMVIKLTRKESELKKEGRLFGQTTLANRLQMQTIEANTKKFLSNYNKHQAMTLGDLELKNKVDTFARLGRDAEKSEDQYRVLFFRLDISGWNSAFREESCQPVTDLLDSIHGTGFYSTVMPAFQHTFFYAPTGVSCETWEGQQGGIEGLHQYTWVVLYEAPLRLTLEQLGFKAETLVRGDDWIAAIHIPGQTLKTQGFPQVVHEIKTALKNASSNYEAYRVVRFPQPL